MEQIFLQMYMLDSKLEAQTRWNLHLCTVKLVETAKVSFFRNVLTVEANEN